jgi:DNA primase catalytic core
LERIDTERLKQDYPIEEVVARYGIELRVSGRNLVGRCPFHADGGRPNLCLYPATRSWYCFRCAVGGDAISFVRRIEGIGFREAVARIQGHTTTEARVRSRTVVSRKRVSPNSRPAWGAAERACLAAAVELYHNRLLTDPTALAYVRGRGLDLATIESCLVGYAGGEELTSYLRWRGLPAQAALRTGILGRDGRETMAGRVVVPEVRAGQPIWLIGRTVEDEPDRPRYLGLSGHKPLLGWEAASSERAVWLVEGVFDWLILRSWDVPAIALVGTYVSGEALRALSRFERLFLALDNDDAGRAATERLLAALGERAVARRLPEVKDVAELALQQNGRDTFVRMVMHEGLAVAA